MSRKTGAAIMAASVTLWAGSAGAVEIYAKAGGSAAEQKAMAEGCLHDAPRASAAVPMSQVFAQPTPAGMIAGGIAAGIMNGVHEAREQLRYRDRCMRKAGWAKLTLTPEEDSAYAKTSGDARKVWVDAFLQGDISARVGAALEPKAPKMPTAGTAEPAVGGVRFDPSALTVAAGPVARGEGLLTGAITHRRTATLHEEMPYPIGIGGLRLPKGSVYHQVELRPARAAGEEESSSLWCGQVHAIVSFGGFIAHCFWTDYEGYHIGTVPPGFMTDAPGFRSWLAASPSFESGATKVFAGPVVLDISDTDLIGPMDFTLKLDRIDKKGLTLLAVASKDGKDVSFWRGVIPVDASGNAILPMWSHRLVMTVQGDKVAAAYTADGDGTGLLDLDATAAKAVASR